MLEKEYQYYIDHKTELVEKYDGKFLIIKDENVIGVFDSEMEAYSQAAKEFEVGTFLIQQAIADTDENKIYFSRVTFSRCGTTLK